MFYQLKKRIVNPWILTMILGIVVACQPAQNELEISKFLIDSIASQTINDGRVEIFTVKASYSGTGILLKGKTTHPEAADKLVAQLKGQNIELTDSIIRLPDPSLSGKTWGLVKLSVVNIRSTPAHAAEMATQALMGTPVRVLQEENGWFLIQTPDNYISWTPKAGIVQMTQQEMEKWKASDRLIFLADYGQVLSSPDASGQQVSDIVSGAIVASENGSKPAGSYMPVVLPDGRKGFILRTACRDFARWAGEVTPDQASLVKSAFSFLGRPYLWGGTSSKGLDCSGFTKTVYMTGGMILSRDASQQVFQGSEVPAKGNWRALETGDLLFFGRTATPELSERATHVGMYIGDSEFIHCNGTTGMVSVNSLDSTRSAYLPYFTTNFLHARRFIGSENSPVAFKSHPWYIKVQ